MKTKKLSIFIYFSLVFLVSFLGCKDKNITPPNVITCPVITLDYNDKSLNTIPKFESIKFIPLETSDDALLGKINKIMVLEDRYVILDAFSAASVMIIDKKGGLIKVINSQGRGPEEYITISDVAFDPFNEEIVIVDSQSRKILKFSKNGDFINELFFNDKVMQISFIDKNTYAYKSTENGETVIRTISHDGKRGSIMHYLVREFSSGNYHYYPRYKDKQLFFENMKDTIWELYADRKEPYLIVDFSERAIDDVDIEALKSIYHTQRRVPYLPKNRSGQIDRYMETDDYIQFFCRNLGNLTLVVIDKTTMDVKHIANGGDHKDNPLSEVIWSSHATDDSGRFIGHISADRYLNLLETKKFKEWQVEGVITIENQGFENQIQVGLDSNPILVVHKLSPIINN